MSAIEENGNYINHWPLYIYIYIRTFSPSLGPATLASPSCSSCSVSLLETLKKHQKYHWHRERNIEYRGKEVIAF